MHLLKQVIGFTALQDHPWRLSPCLSAESLKFFQPKSSLFLDLRVMYLCMTVGADHDRFVEFRSNCLPGDISSTNLEVFPLWVEMMKFKRCYTAIVTTSFYLAFPALILDSSYFESSSTFRNGNGQVFRSVWSQLSSLHFKEYSSRGGIRTPDSAVNSCRPCHLATRE